MGRHDDDDDDYPSAVDGEVVEIDQGTIFNFACCGSERGGCSLVHDLVFNVADDGTVEMQVTRNESETNRLRAIDGITDPREIRRTERRAERAARRAARDSAPARPPVFQFVDNAGHAGRSEPTMPSTTQRHRRRTRDGIDPYETVVDDDGRRHRVLRDGATARVSFFDAQVARGASAETARAAEAARITQAVEATRAAMGNGPPAVNTGPHSQYDSLDLSAHRPGYRFSDGIPPWQPEESEPVNEWETHRPRLRRAAAVSPEGEGDDDNNDEGGDDDVDDSLKSLTPSERARAVRCMEDSVAWMSPAARDALNPQPGTGLPTRVIPTSPVAGDRWALGTAQIGDACMTNGQAGKLALSDDGSCLVCKVTPLGATRSGRSAGDAAPLTQEANEINREAWRGYVDQLQNAWRS